MRKSIATVCLSGTLTEKLTAAARAGFDGVEIFENDLLASPLAPEEIAARTADLGLSIDLYQPMRDIEAVPEETFARNLRRARHKFDLMRRLGADTVLVCSSISPQTLDDDALAAEQLSRLADLAQESGVRVAYEALAWGRHVSTYDHAWRIVESAGHPALGTCLDSFHILSRGSDPKGIEDIPGEKIFFLQLADAPLMAMDVLQWSRHYRCFPGQGGFDVAGFLRHVLNAGYDGPLSLEVFNDVFRQADAGRTALDGLRSLLALEENAGVSPLPAPVIPSGVAFAELATSDPEPVGELLTALGFTRTARHHGKPVDLWEQGEARVLVNTGSAGRRTDTTLAAVGLETADPAASARRAEALLAPALPKRPTAQDVPLESVAAPDGTEVLFCATGRPELPSWTDDFAYTAESGPADVTAIDHLALTQPWHHFDESVLFHRTVLGLSPHDTVELADPYGLFRSRALSASADGPRLVLNLAPTPEEDGETRARHVAFAVEDVVAAVRRFRAAGAGLLRVPANYYDDLEARFEFAEGELETYRALGILYDRDERGGEFRHCYTETVGHVFFEFVQRTGGYSGFGAANAPIRLAAQRR
ncbi:sugar phosphate isomerase/epimerase and 4-hydroxyphenylpyruvate domain-containing protein [Streptomyces sp. SID13726]|uniref:bifunctional sugar phosphate isomerase/epimerase/4-hydroxyphenylpyruvate dioxygenase family protein n=1 Tax=Streptomyces sp. SID13726 TaxID=2706058 RepID=UPI0013B6AD50|nr:sugar phosphate isomerase/epimerase and 4-hydroxyphenylpyruvate domain-containing protein [Streptomyces sp. SID13726]NEA98346.1 sugar phosphate isomerase/epimerase and 4-hydroxyphenylpyruvate domain-containing protein [Streptomyces sp. SID13726]